MRVTFDTYYLMLVVCLLVCIWKVGVHLPFDHKMLVQNLSTLAFNNASVSSSVRAISLYIWLFGVRKFLQPGTFDLVGTIVYENQLPYQNTFYNGTIEVTEAGCFVSVKTVFLVIGIPWTCSSCPPAYGFVVS